MKQIKSISLLTIFVLLLTAHSYFAQEQENKKEKKQSEITEDQGSNLNAADKTKDEMVYQCPMDLKIISNVPGNCSKCGMKLNEYTLDEAINNLSGGGHKKPELKNKRISMSKKEKNETEEISREDAKGNLEEEGFEEMDKESEHEHGEENMVNAFKIDKNGDGKVYQCTMCPDQLSDESSDCEKCGMELIKLSVEDAQKNLAISEN